MFLLWVSLLVSLLVRLRQLIDFDLSKIARRVYALGVLNAMEKKVPRATNAASHKAFGHKQYRMNRSELAMIRI
jgi:hypothetical protein